MQAHGSNFGRLFSGGLIAVLVLTILAAAPVQACDAVLDFAATTHVVNLGDDAVLQFEANDEFTVELWMKMRTMSGMRRMFLSKTSDRSINNSSPGTSCEYTLGFHLNHTHPAIIAWDRTAWRTLKNINDSSEPTWATVDNRWMHAAFTVAAGKIRAYVNGAAVGSEQNFNFPAAPDTDKILYIGGYSDTYASHIDGLKSDVRIWDHARTAQQIQDNMNLRLNGNESGLIGYWPLNEGAGGTAADLTANENDGTIVDATWAEGSANEALVEIADPETGNMRIFGGPTVDLITFAPDVDGYPFKYTHYQFTIDDDPLNPAGWLPAYPGPAQYEFSGATPGDRFTLKTWFTNTNEDIDVETLAAPPVEYYYAVTADNLFVATDGDYDIADGLSWATAFPAIQDAFDIAIDNCTIRVAGGTYLEEGPQYGSALIWRPAVTNLTLRGGYEGSGEPGNNDSFRWPTAIRAGGDFPTQNRLLLIDDRQHALVENLTFENAGLTGWGGPTPGLGVRVLNSTDVTLRNCRILNCRNGRTAVGSGFSGNDSTGVIDGCLISRNYAGSYGSGSTSMGAGIALDGGAWTVRDTVVSGNLAGANSDDVPSSRSALGGGIYLNGNHTLQNVLVVNNGGCEVTRRGGGIYVAGGSPVIANTTIVGNYPDGLYVNAGTVTLRNSILWRNHGNDIVGTVATRVNNIISDGTADTEGGVTATDPLLTFPSFFLAEGSPAIGAGSMKATAAGVADLTSFTNNATYADPDNDDVNLGYHYPLANWTNIYVAIGGSGDGSAPGSPLGSIGAALALPGSHIRIHIAAGTYGNAVEDYPLWADGRTVQFLGTNTALTVLDVAGVTQVRAIHFRDNLMGDTRITGMTARGVSTVRYGPGTGCIRIESSGVRMEQVRIADSHSYRQDDGVGIHAMGSSLLLEACAVEDNRMQGHSSDWYRGAGLYQFLGSATFRGTVFAGNWYDTTTRGLGAGMHLRSADTELYNVVMYDNTIPPDLSNKQGGGIYVSWPNTRVLIENSTIADNAPDGLYLRTTPHQVQVFNSIFNNHGPRGDFHTITENDFWYTASTQLVSEVQGNITLGDPRFVDAPGGNYRLKTEYGRYVEGTGWIFDNETSPLIDAGTNRAWMAAATDLDGRDRLARGIPASLEITVDMGAYEMHPMPRGTLIFMR